MNGGHQRALKGSHLIDLSQEKEVRVLSGEFLDFSKANKITKLKEWRSE